MNLLSESPSQLPNSNKIVCDGLKYEDSRDFPGSLNGLQLIIGADVDTDQIIEDTPLPLYESGLCCSGFGPLHFGSPLSELSGILGGCGYVDDEATFALHQSREVL